MLVQGEVKKSLATVQSLTEKDLNQLDARICALCKQQRGEASQRQADNDDQKSVRSHASVAQSSASRAKSMQALKRLEVADAVANIQNRGKPQGMSEEQWNEIV